MTAVPAPDKERVALAIKGLGAIRNHLCNDFVAKDEIIEMMLVCAIAQEPMVIFGEPGTAKSAIISRFCDLLGLQDEGYFKYLLTSFTEPDELFGVVDIKAYMGDGMFTRVASFGSIQRAKIVFLDEVFRANSAILNALLSIINERIYYEGGKAKPAQTQVIYGASNNAPTSLDLQAFYARFPIRVRSERVSETHPDQLLEKGWALEFEELQRRSLAPETRMQSPLEQPLPEWQPEYLDICQRWLYSHWTPYGPESRWADNKSALGIVKRVYLEIIQMMNTASDQFRIDDRKAVKLFKLILAHALLHGRPDTLPTLTDVYDVLRHTWEDPELATLAAETVLGIVREANERYAQELGASRLTPVRQEL
jgi:MoxR-like ATPase